MSSFTGHLVATVAIMCLGSLQFGYHMSELNSPESIISCSVSKPGSVPFEDTWFGEHQFARCIPMSTEQVGLITSIFSIGGLIGSLYVGTVADKIGRKKTSMLHCVIYFFGSSLNGLSQNYGTLLVGRFVAGLGAGAALVVTPVFINEVSPPDAKGFLGSMNQVSVNVGILLTQVLALRWCNNNDWRWLLLTGSILAVVTLVLIFVYVDESPMWLVNKGYPHEALRGLHRLRGGEYHSVRSEVSSWSQPGEADQLLDEEMGRETANSPAPKPTAVSLDVYLKSPEFNPSKIVATGILILQQFCGINSIIFYGVSVLISIFPSHSIIINCMISVTNAVVTFVAAGFVDRLGRKPLLLTSVAFMGIATVLMGFGILTTNPLASIIGTFTYITFFAIGLGPIPFLLVGEVTQPRAKASAQSWGTTMNWVATFIVGFLFPILKSSWIGGGVYFIFTGMCILTFGFIKTQIPETKGKLSYEEVWNK
ncbi:hypothetical protein CANTEDRAFT_121786 [Yamadazyma tenuis ATCC 10573]|uniref:Major facilitator superfamily (MFS) profile domain-containing protein n=1 Tax=Candida tenuis (strain ATCC 10573 / BCRC 21748 / CBS 615 / JCM 9827 / NBRC 10315 / NRRL Y-1498 / VKM Y-70) TaxID=590646 RepID=G3B496_CANTC|nr:uncharacterized protein CANTEDRAFT_121786 [Yamadazyma tenuis ATCC 10573]EGV63927.1 hypothetical protein CANTEDRAFT_121786 [Yamadazyma tenuis ATCC 10573]